MGKGRKSTPIKVTLASVFEEAFAKAGTNVNAFKDELPNAKGMLEKGTVGATKSWESVKESTTPLNIKPKNFLGKEVPEHDKSQIACFSGNEKSPKKTSKINDASSRGSKSTPSIKQQPSQKIQEKKAASNSKRKKKPSNYQSGYCASDLACYGSAINKTPKISLAPEKPFEISITGQLKPNSACFPQRQTQRRIIPDNVGNEINLSGIKTDACEIVLGLDFGTSCVKVVIHDPQRQVFYAVPFYPLGGTNAYLYSCRVYVTDKHYSLEKGDTAYADLKLPLMENGVDHNRIRHAIAFLALIIRHARGWFFSNHGEIYCNSDIDWVLNLGLPTAYSENNKLSRRFKQIALTAINLAGDAALSITEDLVTQYFIRTLQTLSGEKLIPGLSIHQDMVNVYPEIGAQVVAFIESESWDEKKRPFITMIDAGAGTVDISFFYVKRERGKRQFNFFNNSVEPNGVMNLHRKRTAWLKKVLIEKGMLTPGIDKFLDEISIATDRLLSVPEGVSNYFENLEVTGKMDVDNEFFNGYSKQVSGLLWNTKQNRVPLNDENWKRLPVFLCGGGSRMNFYRRIIENLNERELSWLRIESEELSKPQNLRAEGLLTKDYDRLSVAYGLSFPELGKIVPSHEISDYRRDLPRRERPVDPTDDG